MKKKARNKGLLERRLENPNYRSRFERGYQAFCLEVQILKALENKGWTFTDLANALSTKKSNISRDLNGGLQSATVSRLSKMAQALDLEFLPLMISHAKGKDIIPRIHKMVSF